MMFYKGLVISTFCALTMAFPNLFIECNKYSVSESSAADDNELDNSQHVQLPKGVQEQQFTLFEILEEPPEKGQQQDSTPEKLKAYHPSTDRKRRSAHNFLKRQVDNMLNVSDPVFYRWHIFIHLIFQTHIRGINMNGKKNARLSGSMPPVAPPPVSFSSPVNTIAAMGVHRENIFLEKGHIFRKREQIFLAYDTWRIKDGKKFGSSLDRNKPFQFTQGKQEVIRDSVEGVAQMSVVEKAKRIMSPDYAYGSAGHPGVIPPHATLVFDVDLLILK